MIWIKEETRERLTFPPRNLDGSIVEGFIEVADDYEFPPLAEPPPNIEGFVNNQKPLINKLIKHLNGLDLYLESDDLRMSWRSGNFTDAIAQWNTFKSTFTSVVTSEEITAFQNDLIVHNIPVSLDSTTLEMSVT